MRVGDGNVGACSGEMPRRHVLLTVLGTSPRMASYVLDGQAAEACLAPVALFNLLPEDQRPDRVLALCTEDAERESLPLLRRDLAPVAPIEHLTVPAGHTQEDVNEYLVTVCDRLSDGEPVDLTLDVTHGFRHFSFLTYTAVLYLEALGVARVRGAFYGLFAKDEPSPFFDLRPLLALPQWVYVLRVLQDTGSAMPMATAVETDLQDQLVRRIARSLRDLSEAYLSGLPIELGRCARDIRHANIGKPLAKLLRRNHGLPLASDLVRRLGDRLEPFVLADSVSGDGWKGRVRLTREELARQARIVNDLLRSGSVPTALGLMNEWTVSWALWRLGGKDDWLDYHGPRRRATSLLGAMRALRADSELDSILTEEQAKLAEFLEHLAMLRNAYAHHGMRRLDLADRDLARKRRQIERVWSELRSFPDWPLTLGGCGGRVLVSPIGMRPGVLFSALQACGTLEDGVEPAMCLAICSAQTDELIDRARHEARYGGRVERIRIDPHGGHGAIEAAVRDGRRHLAGAEDVFVNVTGGTTVMGLVAEAMAAEARRFARPVRRFGLIDRRPPAEQDADPYQVGEPFWLDGAEAGDADQD